jgi:two-component system chemotaxis response regulator CheY
MTTTVLIVDDSQLIRGMVVRALGAAGYRVVEARDGVEGLSRLEQDRPALVICDVNMPRMNGVELLEAARQAPDVPPFLMLTTEADPAVIAAAKAAGARAWIQKPFRADLVLAAVRKLAAP